MPEIMVGCSGWSYQAWDGPFYPRGLKQGDYLEFYSEVFGTVEIDSTFYSIPPEKSVLKWKNSTPPGFRFSPKVPREITHDMKLRNTTLQMERFIERMEPLGPKIAMFLIQLPPFLKYEEGFADMKNFVEDLPGGWPFAVEFRDNSWFRDDVYRTLEDGNVTMAWSEIPMASCPAITTTDTVYLRLVGDRKIQEDSFGSIQRNMNPALEKWAGRLKALGDDIRKAYVYSNNHFQGFGPGTVNLFRSALGLDPVKWPETYHRVPDNQRTLF